MNHTSLPKTRLSRARLLFSLSFVTVVLFDFCPTIFGQAPNAKPTAAHLKSAAEEKLLLEDVFFNADAREVSPITSLAANQMSANSIGSVLSLLFDSARVSLQSESDPMVATWSGTITIPTNTAIRPRPKSYLQDIRGSVNKTADTRVTIVLDLGGKGFVVEFPYGMKHDGNIRRRFNSLAKPSSSGRYTASILIFAERRNLKGAVLVDIDSLDIDAR